MALSVARPATSSLKTKPSVTVTEYFVNQQAKANAVLVPSKYQFSGDPSRLLGEQAEELVVKSLEQCPVGIPGLKLLVFHGLRIIGKRPGILREVDTITFAQYNNLHYILFKEVKCNQFPKRREGTRKKAVDQLTCQLDILATELGIPTANIQRNVVWPNMPPTEPCTACGGAHPSLYERPAACRQRGTQPRTNPEPPGFHLFQDTFQGTAFEAWMRSKVSDPQLAVSQDVYSKVLQYVTEKCYGVLLDQTVGSFCLLSPQQHSLVTGPQNTLTNALLVVGRGGTGKTTAAEARVQFIIPWLSPTSKALYVYFDDNVKKMVTSKLIACQVDLTYVHFIDFHQQAMNLANIIVDDTVMEGLINSGYHYIYVDGFEDVGIAKINKLMKKILAGNSTSPTNQHAMSLRGDCWLMMDDYQGLQDPHALEKGFRDKINWRGTRLDEKVLEQGMHDNRVVKLTKSFRSPQLLTNHIKKENLPHQVAPPSPFPMGSSAAVGSRMVTPS